MSFYTLLAAQSASPDSAEPSEPGAPTALPLAPSTQILVDGNSISAGHIAIATLADTLTEALGADSGGARIESVAVNGQTWADMLAKKDDPGDLTETYRPAYTHHLIIANETTNSIRLGASVEQTKQDITAYFGYLAETYPAAVVLAWPALPAGHADAATYPQEPGHNAAIVEINEWMRANLAALSIDAWVEVRAGHPQFDHDGSAAEKFQAFADGWQESPPSKNLWPKFGWLHPAIGKFPAAADKGRGKRAIAAALARALTSGEVPPAPVDTPVIITPWT
ncbi:hypothetical protein ACUIAJ_03880 [Dermabacteraceae bacterium CCM 9519]